MLLDKLEQASRQVLRMRLRTTAVLALAALVTGVFLTGLVRLDLAPSGTEAPAITETGEPASRNPADPARRAEFIDALGRFDRELAPAVSDVAFAAREAGLRQEILAKKDAAVAAFAEGDYATALAGLSAAAETARAALARREAAFAGAMAAAEDAAAADDHPAAAREIAAALALEPDDAAARRLKARIDRLPAVLALIEKAAVARRENDLSAEAEHLEAALQIDPERTALADRLSEVSGAIREKAYADHVAAAWAALDRRDVAAAGRGIAAARAVFEGRPETALLERKWAALARELAAEILIDGAEAAAEGDDWETAARRYGEVLKIFPDSKTALDGAARAAAILSLDERFSRQLAAPERLSAPAVADRVRALLDEARPHLSRSASLSAKAARLSALEAAYAVEVPVRIVSDGETSVSVRGIGRVGKTTGRTIELRPGRYTFEGARAGFRSKLVEVRIPPGARDVVVEIRCDERI